MKIVENKTPSFEEYVMGLIVNGGSAKSGYIEAIRLAKDGKYDEIEDLWKEANDAFEEAHKTHFEMLNAGLKAQTPMEEMMLIHAEDQLNSAEIFKVIAEEMVNLYKVIDTLK